MMRRRASKEAGVPVSRRRKQLLPWILSGSLLAAALGLVVVKIQEWRAHALLEQERDEMERQAYLFQEAQSHIRERNWTQAKTVLEQLQAASPTYPGVQDSLQRVKKEIPNQRYLEAARVALAQKRLDEAARELKYVSSDTAMSDQLDKLRSELQTATLQAQMARLQSQQADRVGRITTGTDIIRIVPDVTLPPESDRKAADALYEEAMKAKSDRKWALAVADAQQALQKNPYHTGATLLLNNLNQEARQMINWRGDDFSPGPLPTDIIQRLESAIEMTVPGDPLHEKFKQKLEQLKK